MSGLTDNSGGLNFTTGLEFQTGMGAAGLTIVTTPATSSFLLLADGTSFFLLADATSKLILA